MSFTLCTDWCMLSRGSYLFSNSSILSPRSSIRETIASVMELNRDCYRYPEMNFKQGVIPYLSVCCLRIVLALDFDHQREARECESTYPFSLLTEMKNNFLCSDNVIAAIFVSGTRDQCDGVSIRLTRGRLFYPLSTCFRYIIYTFNG
jgi:hypothetical protein